MCALPKGSSHRLHEWAALVVAGSNVGGDDNYGGVLGRQLNKR